MASCKNDFVCTLLQVINPLSTNIHTHFLNKFIEIEFDNRLKHFPLVIILLLLITFSIDDILMLLGEN